MASIEVPSKFQEGDIVLAEILGDYEVCKIKKVHAYIEDGKPTISYTTSGMGGNGGVAGIPEEYIWPLEHVNTILKGIKS